MDHLKQYPYSSEIELAGILVRFDMSYADAEMCFRPYERPSDGKAVDTLRVDEAEWKYIERLGFPRNGQMEASLLTALSSDVLLHRDRCLFHAAAIRFRNRAWLIAGDSGVGKSTQTRNLQRWMPGEFSVISGDRPVLHIQKSGEVMVYPSPWNGKENWKGAPASQLEGIVFLRRGAENSIRRLTKRQSAIPAYIGLIQSGKTKEEVLRASAFAERLINACAVWELTSFQVPDSTGLLFDTVFNGGV